MSTTVDIPQNVLTELKKFRFRKSSQGDVALVLKIDKKALVLAIEDTLEGVTPEELADELPENSPRFVVYSYKLEHADGRVSFVCSRIICLAHFVFLHTAEADLPSHSPCCCLTGSPPPRQLNYQHCTPPR